MPTYEFECETCEYFWEEIRSIKNPIPEECPECKAATVTKVFSLTARGKVELTGQEIKDDVARGAGKILERANKDSNFLGNLVGEEKYHNNELSRIKK